MVTQISDPNVAPVTIIALELPPRDTTEQQNDAPIKSNPSSVVNTPM